MKQRDGRLRDGGDPRVDVRLAPRDEPERDRGADQPEHRPLAPRPAQLGDRAASPHRPCQVAAEDRGADCRPRAHQRPRLEPAVDGHLDEEVRRSPHRREQQQQGPVAIHARPLAARSRVTPVARVVPAQDEHEAGDRARSDGFVEEHGAVDERECRDEVRDEDRPRRTGPCDRTRSRGRMPARSRASPAQRSRAASSPGAPRRGAGGGRTAPSAAFRPRAAPRRGGAAGSRRPAPDDEGRRGVAQRSRKRPPAPPTTSPPLCTPTSRATPTKPTPMPASRMPVARCVGSSRDREQHGEDRRRRLDHRRRARSSIRVSAKPNSQNGSALLSRPSDATIARSGAAAGRAPPRLAAIGSRIAAPTTSRPSATTDGLELVYAELDEEERGAPDRREGEEERTRCGGTCHDASRARLGWAGGRDGSWRRPGD